MNLAYRTRAPAETGITEPFDWRSRVAEPPPAYFAKVESLIERKTLTIHTLDLHDHFHAGSLES